MNDVPLVKANNIHDINTSIIAIKKQLKQLNEAVGLIDMPTIDTSIFVKKSEVVDVVEEGNMNPVTSNAVVPVDEVTSGNMHSVSSNAVYEAINNTRELVLTENVQTRISVPANSWKDDNMSIPAKNGYTVISIFLYVTTGGAFVELGAVTSSVFIYRIYNSGNASDTYNVKAKITYLKN